MPEEKIEKLPDPGKKSGGNPMLPVLVLIIVLPAIAYTMVEFLFIPKLKATLALAPATAAAPAKASAHGAPAKAPASGGHSAKPSGHGAAAPATGDGVEFKNIVANLSGSLRSRYVKVSFIVQGSDPNFSSAIESNRVQLIDAALGVLSIMTIQDLEEPGIKNVIRNNLIAAFDSSLGHRMVEELYFSELVVQ